MKKIIIYLIILFWTKYSFAQQYTQYKDYCNITGITTDIKGSIWATSYNYIYKFDGNTWDFLNYPNAIISTTNSAIAIDKKGNKWLSFNDGIGSYNDTNWTIYTKKMYSGNWWETRNPYPVSIDKHNNKWFGTHGLGLLKYNDTTWTTYSIKDGLVCDTIYSIAVDLDNNVWIGTPKGLSKFDNITWTTYLLENSIPAIAVDSFNTKWIATNSNGIYKLENTNWTHITTENSLLKHRKINCITIEDKNKLWFGGDSGICRFYNDKWNFIKPNKYLANNPTALAIDLNHHIWVTYNNCVEGFGTDLIEICDIDAPASMQNISNSESDIILTKIANNQYNIEMKNGESIESYSIYSISGQLLSTSNSAKSRIELNVNTYNSGTYLICIKLKGKSIYKKIIF